MLFLSLDVLSVCGKSFLNTTNPSSIIPPKMTKHQIFYLVVFLFLEFHTLVHVAWLSGSIPPFSLTFNSWKFQ